MFCVTFYVDDKKLGPALFALVGIAQGQPGVTPVVNAMEQSGKIVARVNGGSLEQFGEALKVLKGKSISAADVRAMMKPIGLAEKSYSYMLKNAMKAHLIKKNSGGQGTSTRYTVL